MDAERAHTLGLSMLVGRFMVIVPMLALAFGIAAAVLVTMLLAALAQALRV